MGRKGKRAQLFSPVLQFAHATKEGTELIFIVCRVFGCIEQQGEREWKRTKKRGKERGGERLSEWESERVRVFARIDKVILCEWRYSPSEKWWRQGSRVSFVFAYFFFHLHKNVVYRNNRHSWRCECAVGMMETGVGPMNFGFVENGLSRLLLLLSPESHYNR